MSFNILEIAKSWIIANNPTDVQKELAQKRYDICLGCEHYRKSRPITNDEYCDNCGCPILKKIFSPHFDACEIHNWLKVDEEYFRSKNTEKKRLI